MSGANDSRERIISCIRQEQESGPDSIGALLDARLLRMEGESYVFQCRTFPWMRNGFGTLHGGLSSTILDQTMGYVAVSRMPGPGIAPAIDLHVDFHRPLKPGENVIVKVTVVSATRTLIRVRSEAYQEGTPEKLCLSGSATYFYKPAAK